MAAPVGTRAVRVLGGEDRCGLILLFCLWEEVLAEQNPLGARSDVLALRSSAELFLGSGAHRTTTVLGLWDTGTFVAVVLVSEV